MGLQLAAIVGLGAWGGHWAEDRWGFAPWGIVAGVMGGSGIGLTLFLIDVFRMDGDRKEPRP
ncbi:MAG: AtpZ/AtpI family protein [Planctomycetes bacterium]|nr:AtpZ/AtpI family protein [Planctomycetota bacterium]